jgi:DNA modification methylase
VNPIGYLETNVLFCADNLDRLYEFPAECVDLIYLDPPFFSNRRYDVIWGDESEMRSFRDRWRGGLPRYIDWVRVRAVELHRVLKPAGSLYFHCDSHASHHLKVMLDGVFGPENFRNEIIWKRTTAHSSAKKFAPIHDTVLCYGKSRSVTWNGARLPYKQEYLDKYYRFDDGDGRLYWRADVCASGIRKGSSGLPWRGFDPAAKGMHWKFTTERLDALDAEGRIYWPKGGTGWPQYKRYRDELKGRAVGDIWDDIDRINPKGTERVGYPTQKPEALLERIIEASSNPGDIVLDPFCGCGTTVSVASRLGRQWIGMDISPTAMRVIRRRLNRARIFEFRIDGLPETEADLRKLAHFEFQNWIIDVLHGKHSSRKTHDYGIDGYSFFDLSPLQVKQVDRVGREEVDEFETAIRRDGKQKGYLIAFGFTSGAHKEVARAKTEGLEIGLVTVATLLDNPTDRPLRADLDDLTRALLDSARRAAAKASYRSEPPPLKAEELEASLTATASGVEPADE